MVPKSLLAVLFILSGASLVAQSGFDYYFSFLAIVIGFVLLLIFITVEEKYVALIWAVVWFYVMVTTGHDGGFSGLWRDFISFLESFKDVKY